MLYGICIGMQNLSWNLGSMSLFTYMQYFMKHTCIFITVHVFCLLSKVKIYDDLGTDVVSNALQGYNACVFAYGQTGSGKTFTMMGSQVSVGASHFFSCYLFQYFHFEALVWEINMSTCLFLVQCLFLFDTLLTLYIKYGKSKFVCLLLQSNPGLIPRICEALFSSMAEGREAGTTYKWVLQST